MIQPLHIILTIYALTLAGGYLLEWLNIAHMRRHYASVPEGFSGDIDADLLKKARDYTVDRTIFGIISSVFGNAVVIAFFFFGLLDRYSAWVSSLGLGFIASGLVFFMGLFCASLVLGAPFNLYKTFGIEKRYGFNAMTPLLWATDFLKSASISVVLLCGVAAGGLWIIMESPALWWFWIWCFFLAVSVFLIYISPYVIEPLFNRFDPVGDAALEERISMLMKKAGIEVARVFKVDASRRTSHTNAYFTGLGRVKRIVLFDTLLKRCEGDEILSVLAHEAGHWKGRHLLKRLFMTEAVALAGLYAAWRLIGGGLLNGLFNIAHPTLFTEATILAFLFSLISPPLSALANTMSRRYEREADSFAARLAGGPGGMISALQKLSKDNLSNLHPHPLYAALYYSHPPTAERIRRLKGMRDG